MPNNTFTFIDLFAGLGGFHLALQSLGGKCVFASELKEDLRKLYKINFPQTPIVKGDITKVNVEDIPPHDVLCAGFPCQPFSQAGKQQGFNDEKDRGNLFYSIAKIVNFHRPKFILLENVSNLKGHDKGNTWRNIHETLVNLEYDVAEPRILSPHQFGIPQHRKRIYIVCADKRKGGLANFEFPEVQKETCSISKIIDPTDTVYLKIKPETRKQLEIWQEFIDKTLAHGDSIPSFPVWAMEFGADYPLYKAPAFMKSSELIGHKGKLGRVIEPANLEDCLNRLPVYARTDTAEVFPHWKIRYIEQNRAFYTRHKEWLDPWLDKVRDFENSHLKFEWNCGKDATPTIDDKIIQFRASGIRVKLPNYAPALNLVGTQIPILPWVNLPQETLKDGEPSRGRYLTIHEAASLQGMQNLKFEDADFKLSQCRCYEALGNAVNVDIVRVIAEKLIR